MTRPVRGMVAAAAATGVLAAGCSWPFGSDEPDPAEAEKALLAQREAVEATAVSVVAATREVLGGEVLETAGRWEGCTSIFPEGFADFRYAADVRLAAAPGSPERLTRQLAELAEVVERSGLEVTGSGVDDVDVRDGAVTARVWDLPPTAADGDLLIRLAAETCVDVPADHQDVWLTRDDPGPDVGPAGGG